MARISPRRAPAVERHHTATAYVSTRGRTLLMWHARLSMWLPPGGHCEPNEDPVEAALREAEEESGYQVEIVGPLDLVKCAGPQVLPPPAVILIEDIHRPDQPYHQHIDHVYYTRALGPVDFAAPVPHGMHHWATPAELGAGLQLEVPGGTAMPVAEDVRLLGIRAIAAAEGVRA